MKSLYAIYGASGFGREVMPLALKQLQEKGLGRESLVFIDDHHAGDDVNGHKVLSYSSFLNTFADERFVSIAIANNAVRMDLAVRCQNDGLNMWSIHSQNTVLMDNVSIGRGSILCPFVTITSNVKIGIQFQANIYSYVAHDCIIGDYVTFAPSVKCNGNVVIHDHAYVGTGAIIKQGTLENPLIIGSGSVIGMGAVVTKNVEPDTVVIGNPARILKRL